MLDRGRRLDSTGRRRGESLANSNAGKLGVKGTTQIFVGGFSSRLPV